MEYSHIFTSLKAIPIFQSLLVSEMEILCRNAALSRYPKNHVVYPLGSMRKNVYVVISGSVKLATETSAGKTLTKELAYKNEIFGENIFGQSHISSEFAETLAESRIISIPIEDFQVVVTLNPDFSREIMKIIVKKLQHTEERLQNFVFLKAKERIVHFIHKSGQTRGKTIGVHECLVDHGMSHKEIAFLTDTSRQTVARIMNELKKENLIHYTSYKSGKILIRDMVALKNFTLA
jgi:CRP-like cAMP-binding protein